MAKIPFDRKTCNRFLVCVGADPDNFVACSAATGCPMGAIQILDDAGNVLDGPQRLAIEAKSSQAKAGGEAEPTAAYAATPPRPNRYVGSVRAAQR